MTHKTIVFDVDGVLADFMMGFTQVAYHLFGAKQVEPYSQVQATQWYWHPDYEESEITQALAFTQTSRDFWKNLDCLVGESDRGLFSVNEDQYNIYFATHRSAPNAKQQTETWLVRKFGMLKPTVVITKNKGEFCKAVAADYAIDDKAENACCIAWLSPGTQSFILDRPYNQFDPDYFGSSKVRRVKTVGRFWEIIKEGK